MYTMAEACKQFGISREALRNWVIEFSPYLSEAVNVEARRQRRLSDEDMQVLALVGEWKSRGKLFADIHEALKSGQRGEIPNVPTRTTDNQQITLENRVSELEAELEQVRTLRHKAEGQVELLEKQLEKLQERLFKREW